jgi:hypothetical protein
MALICARPILSTVLQVDWGMACWLVCCRNHSMCEPIHVPPVLACLQFIMHDWGDEDCLRILKNARAAVKPGGRIIILDQVCGMGIALPRIGSQQPHQVHKKTRKDVRVLMACALRFNSCGTLCWTCMSAAQKGWSIQSSFFTTVDVSLTEVGAVLWPQILPDTANVQPGRFTRGKSKTQPPFSQLT